MLKYRFQSPQFLFLQTQVPLMSTLTGGAAQSKRSVGKMKTRSQEYLSLMDGIIKEENGGIFLFLFNMKRPRGAEPETNAFLPF